MTVKLFSNTSLILLSIFIITSCARKESELVWNKNLAVIGSQSSPRAADLNDDGVLDIVMGAGKNEFQSCDQGILAFDGKTGELLWQQKATDQVYGSPTFYDITGDGVQDVFIGGRLPHLKALNGRTGDVIWEYTFQYERDSILKYACFNFSNSVIVPDQDHDGSPELLIMNGGNAKAAPNSEMNRYPAVLMVMDAKNGNILAADTMPDGKESYLSPVCFTPPDSKEPVIIFGTGGETISGHLYRAKLSDLMERKLSHATVLASENGHGFIAPPSLADVTHDGYPDIIAISHGSTVFAIDGKTGKEIWRQVVKNTESSNSFGVGYFTEDDVPDFFTFVSKGEWPRSKGSLQIMLDGKDGRIAYMDSMGCTGFSSPVIYDLNGDGRDEAIISINDFDCALGFTGKAPRDIENKLIAIDFQSHAVNMIDHAKGFKNIFSTPWIGDLDGDGYLDIVHCQYYHRADLMLFLGMRVKRIETPVRVREAPLWGAYMGSAGNGLFMSTSEISKFEN